MSVDVTPNNKKNIKSTSILLKKAKKATGTVNETTKKRSPSFSNRIQAAGLSLVASISRRRSKPEATTRLNQTIAIDSSSSTSLPNPPTTTSNISTNSFLNSRPVTPRLLKLRPSVSARPFSQFFFPVKEESNIVIDESMEEEQPENVNLKQNKDTFLESPSSLGPAQHQHLQHQQHQQQQQQQQQHHQQQQVQQQQQTNQRKHNRHSLALDFVDRQQKISSRSSSSSSSTTFTDIVLSSSSNSSSRSSSLKTVRNQQQLDLIAVADDEEYDTFQCKISDSRTNAKEKRLSSVARARTVLGFDSLKVKETRAIHVWRETVSQLLIPCAEGQSDSDEASEIYKIMAHPALVVCITLF
jgi:hypothetical protein